ncbi:MAG: NPCBM/NEW2 domain-containing protein [Muribaculaceae bacterium]|nr:NPCBM/NEW2 domain-containing protein [Muribaculaceae bacterium]
MRTITEYTLVLALSAILMSPAAVAAQEVKVLTVSAANTSANIKAEIKDATAGDITEVVGRTFRMSTGESTTRTGFETIGDNYISVDLDTSPGNDYFYRLEVTFKDGTTCVTDCFNAGMTEGAVWLSDLEPSATINAKVGYDKVPDGDRMIQIHPASVFEKGVSLRSTTGNTNQQGYVTFNTARQNQYGVNFEYMKFTMGLQAYASGTNDDGTPAASNGYSRIELWINGVRSGSCATYFAYSNPSRGSKVYYHDRTEPNAAGINTVQIRVQNSSTNFDNNIVNTGAARLYYTVPQSEHEAQTITFDTPGGIIHKASPEVALSAYASGRTPVFYSIIQGKEIATLEGNILRPIDGKGGEVVVEAFTFGNDTYGMATATQTYKFNFGPTVEYLSTYSPSNDPGDNTLYLYVEPQGKMIEKLQLDLYDDVRSFNSLGTVDLIAGGLENYATAIPCVYAIPASNNGDGNIVHRLTYKFSGEDEVTGRLFDGAEPFVYMSDLSNINVRVGYNKPYYDEGYGSTETNKLALRNSKYTYGKGYGVHAAGYIETPASLDLSQFSRFRVDVGGQAIANTSRGRIGFNLYNGVSQAYLSTGNVTWDNVYEWDFPLQSTGTGKTLKIEYTDGGDRNANDVVCIGAPRFYYPCEPHAPQTIEWQEEEIVHNYTTTTLPLTAKTSSGLPVIYRVIRGNAYGSIVENDKLKLVLPKEDFDEIEVLVEAYQPGDNEYAPSPVAQCRYRLRRSVVIKKDERVELLGGHDIDELIIFADGKSSGQAVVSSGVVNIDKLVLKYTFTPGVWHHIAFPSDLNLESVSDLKEKGLVFSDDEEAPGTYIIREYSTQSRADDPDGNPWHDLAAPVVEAQKGYIMKVNTAEPMEITFDMHNVALDFESSIRGMRLSVDMSACMPETHHTIYIRPKNVRGNTLRVDMRYVPTDYSGMPLNHAYALKEMRVTRTPVRGGIRLTLSEQSPCRVGIYDKKGKKLLKAVNYVAPMQIDISDLKPGKYLLTVAYGPAYREMLVDL